ncbi:PhzF family phenazine biosynthesis protein [Psychroflexus aestuariivivens]|uniref:PhzF family phenazine biosynthesis protein n=1 Tax=Psychroflexus aestuariivivens TaxID=1795040 RepID=UPI000FD9F8E3|nr:PhzF family phenazine biosynthesis protein [Psychroflexus aestuariivivens]
MNLRIYQIDAFSNKIFSGNPAAVCPLEEWLSDDILQKIAQENNLAETAFYVKQDDFFQIRWFTPKVEVDLCGHATLATAFVLFNHENYSENTIHFHSYRSGTLTVSKKGTFLSLNFPSDLIKKINLSNELKSCFNIQPKSAYKGKSDYMLLFETEEEINNIKPNFNKISKLNSRGIIITAKGNHVDFVSRFFAPQIGVTEDPVTGSTHTTLTPFWSRRLSKTKLSAIQLSNRKGYLECEYLNDRVEISGEAELYMKGEIYLELI